MARRPHLTFPSLGSIRLRCHPPADEGTRRLNSLRRDDLDARFPGLLDLAIAQGRAVKDAWPPR